MAVKTLSISNFKSFEDLQVELGKFNVLIGANASGKSNFVEVFRFLRDTAKHGLDNSMSMQGGVKYLRNVNIASSKDLSLRVVYDPGLRFVRRRGERFIGARIHEVVYEFAIRFGKTGERFTIAKDETTLRWEFVDLGKENDEVQEAAELGTGELLLANVGGELEHEFRVSEGVPLEEGDIPVVPFLGEEELEPTTLLLETPFFMPVFPFERFFDDIAIYDFDPRLPKRAVTISGKMELEEDGTNLAIVLRNLKKDKEKRRKFSNLLRDLLPFVDDLDVDKFAGRSLLLKSRETYTPDLYLPASQMSDGTINVVALIVALYFEEKPLVIVEEPERNIDPYLISKVVDMLKEASEQKQIIITTHNPEIVKHVDLENLLLVARDKKGFSAISRPGEKEGVRTFLENEMGIEELYVQGLLGA